MSSVRVPINVSSITFASSGPFTPDGNSVVTGETDIEATVLDNGAKLISTDLTTGAATISVPSTITALTINGISYTATGGVTDFGNLLNAPVPAADATIFLTQNFRLVQG